MGTTWKQEGDTLKLTAPGGGVTVDVPLLIGNLLVVPQVTAAATVSFSGMVTGVHTLAKAAGVAWTEGQKLYWDATNEEFSTVSTVGQLAGVAAAVAASAATTGDVRLNGVAPDTAEGAQAAITSLTDNGGGTGDDTVEDMSAATTLTDSTTLDGSHDDTIDPYVALTDYTAHASGAVAVTSNAATDLDTTAAALATLEDEVAAALLVVSQNQSNFAQKIIELVTWQATVQNNITDVLEKQEEILAALRLYGVIST